MSFSIYYVARRKRPLSDQERAQIASIEAEYSVEEQIEEREQTGTGPNWESFCTYDCSDPSEPNVVFEGATKLPDNSEEVFWAGIQHWCAAISAIRRVLVDAEWDVRLNDHQIHWDDIAAEYDPTR